MRLAASKFTRLIQNLVEPPLLAMLWLFLCVKEKQWQIYTHYSVNFNGLYAGS